MTNAKLDTKLQLSNQEDEYWFPYHYVAQYRKNQFTHNFLDTWAINYVSTIEYLHEKIGTGLTARIVDIGCGDGRFSRELSQTNENSNVIGIDYSKKAIALASAMNPDVKNLQFRAIDINDTHDIDTSDIAILMEVFEHIPLEDADEFMASVRGLIKKGGLLYLTVPHENKPVEYKHFQHFSIKKITQYLEPHFDIVEAVPFEKKSWARKVIFAILNNKLFILNNPILLSVIYRWYKNNIFYCNSEKDCQRIFIKAVAK